MNPTDPESAGTAAAGPILGPGHTYASVTDKISAIVLVRPYNWRWFLGMAIGFCSDDDAARVAITVAAWSAASGSGGSTSR